MATPPKTGPDPSPGKEDPVSLEEPSMPTDDDDDDGLLTGETWMRGLHMLIFAVLIEVAKWILLIATALQFLWMLFAKEKNRNIAEFGESLARWIANAARFQTGGTDDKPFPWSRWGK